MNKICVLGSINLDIVVKVKDMPLIGQTIMERVLNIYQEHSPQLREWRKLLILYKKNKEVELQKNLLLISEISAVIAQMGSTFLCIRFSLKPYIMIKSGVEDILNILVKTYRVIKLVKAGI